MTLLLHQLQAQQSGAGMADDKLVDESPTPQFIGALVLVHVPYRTETNGRVAGILPEHWDAPRLRDLIVLDG
jgi:hypothetical protein